MKLVVIGLGRMGAGIARRLPRDTHEVVGWDRDRDREKRTALQKSLERALPDVSISRAARRRSTSSGPAVTRLCDAAAGPEKRDRDRQLLFIGDAIYPGGNDYAVVAARMPAVKVVTSPQPVPRFVRLMAY